MKTLIRVVAAIIGLFLILWLAFALFAEPYLKSTIEEKLTYYQGDTVEVGAVNIHFFPIGLKVKDVHFNLLVPSDSLLVGWAGNISHASVAGVEWYKAWKDNTWDVATIGIGKSSLNWNVRKKLPSDSSRFEVGKGSKPQIILRKLEIEETDLRLTRDSLVINLETALTADSISVSRDDSLNWAVKRVTLNSQDAIFENVVPDFDLGYRLLRFDSMDSLLTIKGFRMKPRITVEEFAAKYPHRKVQPDLYISTISLDGIELGRLSGGLYAGNLIADSCDFRIYQDLRKERENVRKPLPSEMIASIPVPVSLDSMIVKNAFLHYQHDAKNPELGKARLEADRINLNAFPISNTGHTTAADVNLTGTARLANSAIVKLDAHFFADKPDHDFKVNLSMGSTSITAFNSILYPTIGIKIKEGYCSKARVNMHGNDYTIQGDLDIAYTDLKIALPPDQEGDLNIFGKIGEGLGNLALVNNNNDYQDNTGTVYFDRPLREPFVNYWWKGIQSGLLDAILTVDPPKFRKIN